MPPVEPDTIETEAAEAADNGAAETGAPQSLPGADALATPAAPLALPAALPPAEPPNSPIILRVVPEGVELSLFPLPSGPFHERYPSPFHKVVPRPGALVTLTSASAADRPRLIRLRVEGRPSVGVDGGAAFHPGWVRFNYALRAQPSDAVGGPAAVAQDVLSPDESELTLLVLPGEKREATLEFHCVLDGATHPGDYPFEVIASDVETGEGSPLPPERFHGTLSLRHPPAQFLSDLPSLYREALREEAGPEDGRYRNPPFFERFLRGFEDAQMPMQETLANLHHLFSPQNAPADFLPWLATWVSLVLDENWPELRRRRLIREAVSLYRWRGTRKGLSRYLQIYAGVEPQIEDQPFVGMRLGSRATLGASGTQLGNVAPHTFVVTLAVPDLDAVNEQIVQDIIDAEKPAHAGYQLRIVQKAPDGDAATANQPPATLTQAV